ISRPYGQRAGYRPASGSGARPAGQEFAVHPRRVARDAEQSSRNPADGQAREGPRHRAQGGRQEGKSEERSAEGGARGRCETEGWKIMAEASLYSAKGEAKGKVNLPAALFEVTGSRRVLHETVVALQANQRRGTSET